mmetsp:Transcript_27778/g.89473  ORF Transcript_27778/g.89473 Transcript_27778/m.89473 type:complete len:302 (-) Transcript_27778:1514-2419(-)
MVPHGSKTRHDQPHHTVLTSGKRWCCICAISTSATAPAIATVITTIVTTIIAPVTIPNDMERRHRSKLATVTTLPHCDVGKVRLQRLTCPIGGAPERAAVALARGNGALPVDEASRQFAGGGGAGCACWTPGSSLRGHRPHKRWIGEGTGVDEQLIARGGQRKGATLGPGADDGARGDVRGVRGVRARPIPLHNGPSWKHRAAHRECQLALGVADGASEPTAVRQVHFGPCRKVHQRCHCDAIRVRIEKCHNDVTRLQRPRAGVAAPTTRGRRRWGGVVPPWHLGNPLRMVHERVAVVLEL